MNADLVIDLLRQSIYLMIVLISVIILPGLVTGLIVAMFQAATQINEMSLSFIPKLIVTLLVLFFAGPWVLSLIVSYTNQLITTFPELIG